MLSRSTGKARGKSCACAGALFRARHPTCGTPSPHIHARAESIDAKATFRDAFARRRGLIFVSSFNEGQEVSPTKTVQYMLTPPDDRPVAIAVIKMQAAATKSPPHAKPKCDNAQADLF